MRQKDLDQLRQFAATPDLGAELNLGPEDPALAQARERVQAEDQRQAQAQANAAERDQITTNAARRRERAAQLAPRLRALNGVGNTVTVQMGRLNSAAERVPTPGGIGGLIVALVVLVSAVVPVNQGYTRLNLLWLTLTGKTSLPGDAAAAAAISGGSSSAGASAPPGTVLVPGLDSANTGAVASAAPANGQTPTAPSGVPSGPRPASYNSF